MDEEIDLDNMLDSMNLTGQWQPSTMPDVSDPSLNSQILDDLFLCSDAFTRLDSSPTDDIHNALVDPPTDSFNNCSQTENSVESDIIADFVSSLDLEQPSQSTIEETMQSMNISQTHTDSLTLSSCASQTDSSSVEPKEIDNFILARQQVRNQQRLLKAASRSRRLSGYRQGSSTVAPINVVPTYDGYQPCATAQNSTEFDHQQQLLQFDSMESKQIGIKYQPRKRFRPRTQAEREFSAHYLRSDPSSGSDYPTIELPQIWASQSVTNIVEVTLVTKDKLPHCYTIDNKQCQPCFDQNALIFRETEPHTLYFRLTPEDFIKGQKSFMIEYVKSKQDEIITKDLIKARELDQSMLRFTRIFEDKNTYTRDESSVAYSCVMTEDYGDVAVTHLGPHYGPMGGNERVYALLKGRFVKDDLTIFVQEELTGWCEPISFTKNRNLVYFAMPPFPHSQFNRAVTSITIFYKGGELYQSRYLYNGSMDQELATLNLNGLGIDDAAAGPSTSSSFDVYDLISATGVRPVVASSTGKRPKRLPAGPRRV